MTPTPEQQRVIDHFEGPLLVEAAAGSGKTATLTQRFVKLIDQGVYPERILCITFTNKAAGEMKSRISKATGVAANKLSLYTFHGFCHHWLKKSGSAIGWDKFTLLDPKRIDSLIDMLCKTNVLFKETIAGFIARGSSVEDSTSEAADLESGDDKTRSFKVKLVKQLLEKMGRNPSLSYSQACSILGMEMTHAQFATDVLMDYKKHKETRRLMDFNDLLSYGLKLINHIEVWREYDFVMGDEIQDSADIDLAILRGVTSPITNNIMVVGDPFQSIYGFRGSSSTNIEDFLRMFGSPRTSLSSNFRCDQNIVEAANKVLVSDVPMSAFSQSQGTVQYYEFPSVHSELKWVTDSIKHMIKV